MYVVDETKNYEVKNIKAGRNIYIYYRNSVNLETGFDIFENKFTIDKM